MEGGIVAIQKSLIYASVTVAIVGAAIFSLGILIFLSHDQIYYLTNDILSALSNL